MTQRCLGFGFFVLLFGVSLFVWLGLVWLGFVLFFPFSTLDEPMLLSPLTDKRVKASEVAQVKDRSYHLIEQ